MIRPGGIGAFNTSGTPGRLTLARAFALSGAFALATALALSACSGFAPAPVPTTTGSASGLNGELTIFAAASLTSSLTELAGDFGADNPGLTVNPISFDGSSSLATQIAEGAPADVFASADQANMEKISVFVDGGPTLFVSNVLQIAVQPGNPLDITRLSDLAKPGVQVVLCAPQVPCGTAAHVLLEFDGVTLRPVSEEQNVTAVLTKVKLGEADAGLVYVTDVLASTGSVEGVTIAGADRAFNSYPIATLTASKNPEAAAAFVAFVLSDRGRAILAKYGFASP